MKMLILTAYPDNVEDFDYLLEMCKRDKADYIENDLGENMVLDKLIVMDDVSGLADKSDEFNPSRPNWQMIMSQTKIFNFFPGSIRTGSILRVLASFASRYKNTYIPHRNVWINKLYFEISSSQEKRCLTIDIRDINALGPGKFRTRADNGSNQICYYNRNKTDTSFDSFLATREQTSHDSKITFSIVKVIDSLNKNNVIYSEITNELNNLKNDNNGRTIQSVSRSSFDSRAISTKSRREFDGSRRVSKKPRFLSRTY